MTEMAEWTVLVFLNAKNNLEPFAFPNFLQMASIGSTKEVNLVVEMGRPKRHYSLKYGGWTTTARFHIEKGQEPALAAGTDIGATNMGDPASLVDFVKWGRATYPAKHTMLVIWNHGQGWRAPPDHEPGPADTEPTVPPQLAGGFRYVSNDDDSGDKLFNRAIQDNLTALLAGERLDVLAFDACLMAMVEAAYAFRGIARVMVGSEELEPGSGWDYTQWVQPLVDAKGAMTPEALGKQLVRAMAAAYGDAGDTTLSAIALDAVAALAAAISAFATTAAPRMTPATIGAYTTARNACVPYGREYGMHSIDLGRFMEQLRATDVDAAVKDAAGAVLTALAACVLDNHASASRKARYGSNGLAIYFPASAAYWAADPDGDGYKRDNAAYPVEFVQKEQWVSFLEAYFKLVP